MSHTVILDIKCKPGAGAQLLPMLLASLADTRAYEGCELVETYVDADDPDHIVLWEKWAARSNQEAYLAWRVETGMMEGLADIVTGPPTVVHLGSAD